MVIIPSWEELKEMTTEKIGEVFAKALSTIKKQSGNNRKLVKEMWIKSRALWIAAKFIADNKIMPQTQEQIYELLKMSAKSDYKKEIEETGKSSNDITINLIDVKVNPDTIGENVDITNIKLNETDKITKI